MFLKGVGRGIAFGLGTRDMRAIATKGAIVVPSDGHSIALSIGDGGSFHTSLAVSISQVFAVERCGA